MFKNLYKYLIKNDFVDFQLDQKIINELHGKKIFLTGGTGVIGKYFLCLLSYLSERYSLGLKVTVYSYRYGKNAEELEDLREVLDKFSSWHIVSNVVDLKDHIGDCDYIFHLAGYGSPSKFSDPTEIIDANVRLTLDIMKILTSVRIHNRLRFFFASTTGVYGDVSDLSQVDEHAFGGFDPLHKIACYIESKRMAETIVHSFTRNQAIEATIGRLSICFGPGISRSDGRFFSDACFGIVEHNCISLTSQGTAKRNFTYLFDACDAILRIGLFGKSGAAYNVSGERSVSIRELSEELARRYSALVKVDAATTYNRFEARDSFVSSKLLRSQLMWKPQVDYINCFERTIDYISHS